MDSFIKGTQIVHKGNTNLPSGHPPVVFKAETKGIEAVIALSPFKGYNRYGVQYDDWNLELSFECFDKNGEYVARYVRNSYDPTIIDPWDRGCDAEDEDYIARSGLRREEEMTELFNNVVRDFQTGKRPKKIAEDYGFRCIYEG